MLTRSTSEYSNVTNIEDSSKGFNETTPQGHDRRTGCNSTPYSIAQGYLERGWVPVPVPYRKKGPTDEGWQNREDHEG